MIAKFNGFDGDRFAIDRGMMERCIGLSAKAIEQGEMPFAALICHGAEILVEATNQVTRAEDITRHAEIVAISKAQQIRGRKDLSDCTLYSTVEPCAMCAFAAREMRIGRVVFAIKSPMMGGVSKWNVLRDTELSNAMPEVFGPVPEVVAGLMQEEAERAELESAHLGRHQTSRLPRQRDRRLYDASGHSGTPRPVAPALCVSQPRPGFFSEIAVLAIGRDLQGLSDKPSGYAAGGPSSRQEREAGRGWRPYRSCWHPARRQPALPACLGRGSRFVVPAVFYRPPRRLRC